MTSQIINANLTGNITLTSDDIVATLGYTPYDASNPNNYVSLTDVASAGYLTAITSNNVVTALGYIPYDTANPVGYTTLSDVAAAGYLTAITSTEVENALGYIPYDTANPVGYITLSNVNLTGPITSVGNQTSIAAQTGSGNVFVMQTSPTLVTPNLGVASVTSINNVTITAPAISATLALTDGTIVTGPVSSDTLVGRATTDVLTNKTIVNRVDSITSSATPTVQSNTTDVFIITALATAATISVSSISPTDGQGLIIRIKDNGTAQTLTWSSSSFRAVGVQLPATTVAGKTLYVAAMWNAEDIYWDVLAVVQQ